VTLERAREVYELVEEESTLGHASRSSAELFYK